MIEQLLRVTRINMPSAAGFVTNPRHPAVDGLSNFVFRLLHPFTTRTGAPWCSPADRMPAVIELSCRDEEGGAPALPWPLPYETGDLLDAERRVLECLGAALVSECAITG